MSRPSPPLVLAVLVTLLAPVACSGSDAGGSGGADDTTEAGEVTDAGSLGTTTTTTATPPPTSAYAAAVLADAPLAYWRLDEPAGASVVADLGAAGVDATVVGGATLGEPPAVGDGTSLRLDGSSAHVLVAAAGSPEIDTLSPSTALTVEAWVRVDDAPDDGEPHYVVRRRWYGWGLFVLDGALAADVWMTDPSDVEPVGVRLQGPTLEPGTWHHVALTVDAARAVLYVDGEEVEQTDTVGSIALPEVDPASDPTGAGGGLAIGRDADVDTGYLRGSVDEVAIYPTALPPERLRAHAAAG